jgi:23S rRNA pseudouridine1911/1915/1917 synthase
MQAAREMQYEDDEIAVGEEHAVPSQLVVPRALAGSRIDKALAQLLPQVSRSRIQQWIEAGAVLLNGVAPSVRTALVEGDRIDLSPPPAPDSAALRPEPMALDVVHADASIIVLDKAPGLVVHPAAGNWSGTLANGLLAYDRALAQVPRAGIVHRLDAGTSGLMVVARTAAAQLDLVRQLQARSVTREYWAIVHGEAPVAGTIDAPIGRDPRNPLRFKVGAARAARDARTHWRRIATCQLEARTFSWLACRLDTGRTHQIRVHLESIGLPLVGDPVYRRGRPPARADDASPWARFERQALHACRLALVHPTSRRRRSWFRAPPADMQALMAALGFDGGRDVDAFE